MLNNAALFRGVAFSTKIYS